MSYATLRLIHVCAVTLSFMGFAARGVGALRGDAWVRARLARTLPHGVDTVLLASALGMLWTAHLAPWALPWLRAKLIGLILYIVLGMVALRSARAARAAGAAVPPAGWGAWCAALLVFGYIVSVAITKNPHAVVDWLVVRLGFELRPS